MTQSKITSAADGTTTRTPRRQAPKSGARAPRKTKSALVREMLERSEGARLDDLCKATGWQPHTVRAVLSGLRKAGYMIDRGKDDGGQSIYRITGTEEADQ